MKAKLILVAIVAALVLLLVTLGPAACNRIRSLTAQSRVNEGQQGALANSARDAIETQGNVAANAAASEDLTRKNTEEIEHAKGADNRIDPDLDAAFVRAACRRQASRNDPKCRMLQPHSARME